MIDFPITPTLGQQYTEGDRTWECVQVGPPAIWDMVPVSTSDANAAGASALDAELSATEAADSAAAAAISEANAAATLAGAVKTVDITADNGATLVENKLPYTGTVKRNQQQRNIERVSVSDFDGDTTTAFKKALTEASSYGNHLIIPKLDGGLKYEIGEDLFWPASLRIEGSGKGSHIELDSCSLIARDVDYVVGRDFQISRIGSVGPALVCDAVAAGFRRSFFDNVGIESSTGVGATFSGGWLFTWVNPYLRLCQDSALVIDEGAFTTGMNNMTLIGGEIQGNASHGIALNRCKQFNLLGTAIEGNAGIGIALGGNVAAVNIQAYFEGNLGGHIAPNPTGGVSAGTAQSVVIQAGSYLLRGTGGSTGPDLAVDIPRCRTFFIEDGVFVQGYASATTPVLKVKDVGDSNRAAGHIGLITIDAPPTLTLLNECQLYGKENKRSFWVNTTLPDDTDTILKYPIWLGPSTTSKRNPSTTMSVTMHLEVTTAGNCVLSGRCRDSSGVLVGSQVNTTAAVVTGYNRVNITVADSENVAYVEVVRTGSSGSDTAVGVKLLSVDVVTNENRVKSV